MLPSHFFVRPTVFRWPMMFILLISSSLFSHPAFCGESDDLEHLLNGTESSASGERLLALIEELKNNKISLNEADGNELRQLPWLTAADARAILLYRKNKGSIRSLQLLETIIGKEKSANIAPFIRFRQERVSRRAAAAKALDVDGSLYSRLFWETTPRKGILNGKYSGANYKLYHRAAISASHVMANLVQEKDIGEADMADFTSFSINVDEIGLLRRVVLGNYKLNLAQGLVMGQGRYLSKGADPIGSARLSSKPIMPYASSSESGFLQGAATTLKIDPFEVTAFYSANHRDATINSTGIITSFGTSGYHRTELETSRKNNITESLSGANLLWHYQLGAASGRVGGSVVGCRYPFPFDSFEPAVALSSISSAKWYSLETDFTAGKVNLFSETAFSEHPDGVSWIAGAEYELFRGFSTVVARRAYGVNYFSPFAGAFAERGDGASNEDGYYAGVQAKVTDQLLVGAYYDIFTFPQLGSHYSLPSDGNDSRLFVTWKQSSLLGWTLQLQHKYKEEEKNQGTSAVSRWAPLPLITNRLQLDCDVTPSERLRLRSRVELKNVTKKYLAGDQPFFGRLFYQQVGYSTGTFSIKGRLTLFNTTDYDAAIYAYEDDLPLTSSLGVYDGEGKSLFVVATWQAMKQMKLAARYETTWYNDRAVYSSGNDERATNAPGSFHLGCLLSF